MKKVTLLFAAISIIMLASTASGDPGAGGAMMTGANLVIAPDGTVLTIRTKADHEPGTPAQEAGMELIAVDPAGSIAWTFESGGGIHDISVIDDLVIVAVAGGGPFAGSDGLDDERTSRVAALTLAAGTTAWELEIDDVVRSLEVAADRIYAVSGMYGGGHGQFGRTVNRTNGGHGHGSGGGHGPGGGEGSNGQPGSGQGSGSGNEPGNGDFGPGDHERTLYAIGLDGSLLWTISLSN